MELWLVHCPGGNATDPIWRVLASSDWISFWTPLKLQHSNPNPNPLANQLCRIDFLTPPAPLIIIQRLPTFLESLMPLKNWCSIHARWSKISLNHSIRFYDCTFEIHQLWQSGFSRVYSNCCCSCSFEPEIINLRQSSHNIHSNNILNFHESTTILNDHTKKVWKLIICASCVYKEDLALNSLQWLNILRLYTLQTSKPAPHAPGTCVMGMKFNCVSSFGHLKNMRYLFIAIIFWYTLSGTSCYSSNNGPNR